MQFPALNLTDGYKVDHRRQYPANTVKVYSNFTPRKSRTSMDSVLYFGTTYLVKEILLKEFTETFFALDKAKVVKAYKRRLDNYLGPNDITYEHIEALHDLQYMPVTIKALPEGSVVKMGVPCMTITNELPEFFWVPNFLETIISCELWPLATSATMALNYRLILDKWALKTTGSTVFSSTFQAHNFSARGTFGRHAAALCDAGHLICFTGSDTIWGIDFMENFYNADSDKEMVSGSVPATEHSVMCMGTKEAEIETFRRLIEDVYPKGFISIVSDTWDFWKVVGRGGYVEQLKDKILARDGRVVIRPDSGDPVKILTGWTNCILADNADDMLLLQASHEFEAFRFKGKFYKSTTGGSIIDGELIGAEEISEDEVKGLVELLWDIFGGETNDLGYRVLDTHIGAIYGDSITPERAEQICSRLADKKFASTNWVAGVGSYSYQYCTRDTYGWAMKATYGELAHQCETIERDGHTFAIYEGEEYDLGEIVWEEDEERKVAIIEPREIFKDPVTDDGTKKSAKGLLVVFKDENGVFFLQDQATDDMEATGELITIYANGKLIVDPTLAEIRQRVNDNIARILNQK